MGAWYACEHPERDNDPSILWHGEGCRGCAIKAEATKRIHFEEMTLVDFDILDGIIRRNLAA